MLAQIKNRLDTFSPSGQRIARLILEDPHRVTEMSVQTCAEQVGVAPSAVIRFCQALGVGSFSTLKLRLAASLSALADRDELPVLEPGAPPNSVFHAVFHSGIHALEDTLRLIDFETVSAICTLFRHARRIIFFGVGTSSIIATDAHYRFTQLGLPAFSCSDIVFMNVTALNMGQGDVAVGISHSGSTKATLDAMNRAKEAGAATVAITSFAESRLARLCDHAIVAFADEQNYPVEAVSARLAHICLIDAIMMTLATMDYETLPAHIKGRNDVLRDIRYQ